MNTQLKSISNTQNSQKEYISYKYQNIRDALGIKENNNLIDMLNPNESLKQCGENKSIKVSTKDSIISNFLHIRDLLKVSTFDCANS